MSLLKTNLFVASLLLSSLFVGLRGQNNAPGTDVLGWGYNVFGEYAKMESRKDYCLFVYSNPQPVMIGSKQYLVPQKVNLKNISAHSVKTVSGESKREYAMNLSSQVGLGFDGFFFSGSVEASYDFSTSSSEQVFYFTYMDANPKWYISLDTRSMDALKTMLDPQFKIDVDKMAPSELFETYGTHYIASAYLGGRMDYTSKSVITGSTTSQAVGLAVQAKYKAVTGNVQLDASSSKTLSDAKTTTDLLVNGGNSEYINSVNDLGQYEKWASGIADMPVLCDFDNKSLRPIWEFASTETRKALLEAEFNKLVAAHPLPKEIAGAMRFANKLYYIKSKSDGLYWDIPGYHTYAGTQGEKFNLYEKDNQFEGKQGIDRFIKVIPHGTDPQYVFFQPQHSEFVADITGGVSTPGAQLQLWKMSNNNKAQMFKMIPVPNEANTYFIEASNGLYLTAGKPITQQNKTEADNQKWVFEAADATKDMAPLPAEKFRMQNVAGGLYIDVRGSGASIQGKGSKLNLWGLDGGPDRTIQLIDVANNPGKYYLQPLHDNFVFDVEGGSKNNGALVQLYDLNNTAAQQFEFVYAGEPMTFFIRNVNSGKYLDADKSQTSVEGCKIQQYDLQPTGSNDHQKWRLVSCGTMWAMPPADQAFYIRCAYTEKYWDLPGRGAETNANGLSFAIWDKDDDGDRKFKFPSANSHSWVNIQVQNGGRFVAIPSNGSANGTSVILYDKTNDNDQKFAIKPTGPNTCVILTSNWRAVTVAGDATNTNGSKLHIWSQHYHPSQQFVLIYADGPNVGKSYKFF